MDKTIAGIAIAVILGLLGGLWYLTSRPVEGTFAACRAGNVAGGMGSIGGPFTLVDHTGATVTEADVVVAPTLIYFGYTFCPDVCPFDMARNAEAVDILDANGIEATPVMISIDPERDTPDVMADFAFNLHERMIGLTGTPEQVKAASQAYKTYYQRQEGDDEFYLVDHSAFTYLVLPGHGTVEFFRREHTPAQIAEATTCYVEAAS